MSALLIDLGGTYLRCGVSYASGDVTVLQRDRIHNFHGGGTSASIWSAIVESVASFVSRMQSSVSSSAPVVMSFPGPVTRAGAMVDAPTVTGQLRGLPDLRASLSRRTGRNVHMLNDVSAAAWHESYRVKANRFLVVTVSSGIGSKIFDRTHSESVLDHVAYAGEIGHFRVDESADAPECDCGGRGHLGAISSGRGIERYARRLAQTDPAFANSLCARELGATPELLTNEHHLVPAAKAGDPWALEVIRLCTEPLARVLLQSVHVAGLERIVVIGGFALALGEIYRSILEEEIIRRGDYAVLRQHLDGLVLMGDEDSCLLGTSVYASRLAGSTPR